VRAKEFHYEASTGAPPTEDSSPEELLLTAVMRCTIASLQFYAERDGVEATATATARGTVTRREEDGRYAFVSIEVEVDARVEPEPDGLDTLLERTERGCFIGASLTVKPAYRWTVNGRALAV
jgi:organic hydroperoxide reductase OsmC/OhrA